MASQRVGQQAQDGMGGDRLPRAAFTHQRQGFALADVKTDAFDHTLELLAATELHGQITYFNQILGHVYFLGSKASRAASPMNTSRLSMIANTAKAAMPSQGACRLDFAWATSSPSDGEPAAKPNPRKSSAVRVPMAPVRMNGMNVMVETMALGRIWRNMIAPFSMPSARAARTYSRLRPRRNSARTTSTRLIHENNSISPSSHQKFGCTKLARMISR